jgi:Ca2+-transporting ATPase
MGKREKDDFLKTGLSPKEASGKLEKFGPNELARKPSHSNLKILVSQFKSPLIYILVFAGWVTIFLREFTDAAVIFSAVIINAVLGFWQERKAQKSLEALRSLLTPQAAVIRDGQQEVVEVREIVPGDLVVLTIGTRIPADGILLEATDFSVNEAILTGESMPVKKLETENLKLKTDEIKKENMAFMGTIVTTGIGKMLVSKTGMETEIGKIGKRVIETEEEETPLQIQLGKLAKVLAIVVGVVALLIFLLGEFFGYGPVEMFTTSVAVAVAAIPEGLVVTLTVILALGMQRILKRKAIVRKLLAAETLGSVSVICVDKTGTLTKGELQVVKDDFTDQELGIKAAILCNDMRDPLEVAMMDWAEEKLKTENLKLKTIQENYHRLDEMPFSPQTKIIATLHPGLLLVSGAPEVVLRQCKGQSVKGKVWEKKFNEHGEKGYRLVGFAYKRVHRAKSKVHSSDLKDLEWLGILIYEDPVRGGVKLALKECQQAGIKIKVITGDYTSTALAVLEQLDLKLDPKTQVIDGQELEKISKTELKKRVRNLILFVRTSPEQKLKIVEALKENDEVVAMMGDGVNDAPALKQADIGIVVGEASDVAKEIADMVLLDSNFATILYAVEEGRTIFENIKKVVLYLLSDSFTEVILIGGSLVLGLPLPVTAAQILWVNLVEDTLPGVALAFEPGEKEVMEELPRPRGMSILDKELKVLIFLIGISTDLILLALFYWLLKGFLHLHEIQTVMFVALGINSLFYIFACRSLRKPIFRYHFLGNKFLVISVLFGFLLLGMAVYFPPLQFLLKTHPLGVVEWLFLFGIGFFNLLAIEGTKWVFIVRKSRYN